MVAPSQLGEVALSLRRRHLRLLLEEYRETRRTLRAARRSRSERARILWLARKHHLRFCLRQLRAPGMTLWRMGTRPRFNYDPACRGYYLRNLQNRLREIRGEWEQLKEEDSGPTVDSLQALLEETEVLSWKPFTVAWSICDLELENVWIGDMEITVDLERFSVRAVNRSIDPEEKNGYYHPHVAGDGSICWDGHDEEARFFHLTGDFLAMKDVIDNLLQTYNPGSPYINLDQWVNGFDVPCSHCGEYCDPDNLLWSEREEGDLCSECRAWCEDCHVYVLSEDYDFDFDLCNPCSEEKTSFCSACGRRFLNEDLQPTGEEDLLCQPCGERKEEENGDDRHDEPLCPLASPVDVSPDLE